MYVSMYYITIFDSTKSSISKIDWVIQKNTFKKRNFYK